MTFPWHRDRDRYHDALVRIREKHHREDSSSNPMHNVPYCSGCGETWPCSTEQIATDALGTTALDAARKAGAREGG